MSLSLIMRNLSKYPIVSMKIHVTKMTEWLSEANFQSRKVQIVGDDYM